MDWFRWYHGACSDAKWPIVARKAGVNVGVVVSVWAALLEHASQNEERGNVSEFDCETFDALYGYEDGVCEAVLAAMVEKGIICDGRICAWSKRQPKREDDMTAERKRRQRSREQSEKYQDDTAEEHTVTGMSRDVTHMSRNVTTDKRREDKRREEDNTLSPEESLENEDHARAKAAAGEREKPPVLAPVLHTVTGMSRNVTHMSRNVTTDKRREDKRREEDNTLSPEESLENEDRARAKAAAGEREKPVLHAVLPGQEQAGLRADENRIGIASDPSIDFQELRQFYSEHFRAEGPLAGFTEYRQLRASTAFPGFSRLYEDLKARLDCRCWDKGFAPGLGKYLREHTWRAPIQARASPHPATATPTEYQRQQQDRREMMRMALQFRGHEHAANEGREVQHGQRTTAATAVAEIG